MEKFHKPALFVVIFTLIIVSGKLFSQSPELPLVSHGGQTLQVYPMDHTRRAVWGPENSRAEATAKGEGKTNTQKIVDRYEQWNNGNYAANICLNLNAHGHSDWHLPSVYEMAAVYDKRHEINGISYSATYWTSTEEQWGAEAAVMEFGSGIILNRYKSERHSVVCVRHASSLPNLEGIDKDVWKETRNAFYTKRSIGQSDFWLELAFGLAGEFKSGLVLKLIIHQAGAKFLSPLGVVKTFFDQMPTVGGKLTSETDLFLIQDGQFLEYSRSPSIYYRQQAPVYKVKEGEAVSFLGFTSPAVPDGQSLPKKPATKYPTEIIIRQFDAGNLPRQWMLKVFDDEVKYEHSSYLVLSKKRLLLPVGIYIIRWGNTTKNLVVEPESHDEWRRRSHQMNAEITGVNTNLYTNPDFNSPVSAQLNQGDKVYSIALIESVDDADRWVKIDYSSRMGSQTGYIHHTNLRIDKWENAKTEQSHFLETKISYDRLPFVFRNTLQKDFNNPCTGSLRDGFFYRIHSSENASLDLYYAWYVGCPDTRGRGHMVVFDNTIKLIVGDRFGYEITGPPDIQLLEDKTSHYPIIQFNTVQNARELILSPQTNTLIPPNRTETSGTFTDPRDGQTYKWVRIGDQVWMAENLKATSYINGDLINEVLYDNEWLRTTIGAYSLSPFEIKNYYSDRDYKVNGINSPEEMKQAYGLLYNWYAVNDRRGICPVGWRMPREDDWNKLRDFLINHHGWSNREDDINGIGNKLKSCRQVLSTIGSGCNTDNHPRWDKSTKHFGTNELGFSVNPAGFRDYSGTFRAPGRESRWWTASESIRLVGFTSSYSRVFELFYDSGNLISGDMDQNSGLSVRCIK